LQSNTKSSARTPRHPFVTYFRTELRTVQSVDVLCLFRLVILVGPGPQQYVQLGSIERVVPGVAGLRLEHAIAVSICRSPWLTERRIARAFLARWDLVATHWVHAVADPELGSGDIIHNSRARIGSDVARTPTLSLGHRRVGSESIHYSVPRIQPTQMADWDDKESPIDAAESQASHASGGGAQVSFSAASSGNPRVRQQVRKRAPLKLSGKR
jgi:hypothetical protein